MRRGDWGSNFVDDDDLVIPCGAIFGVFVPVHLHVGADVMLLHHALPPRTEGGAVEGHAFADDGDKASTLREAGEGAFDVFGGLGGVLLAGGAGAERWVHHDHGGADTGGEDVVDLLGVFFKDLLWDARGAEEGGAAGAEFVGKHRGTGSFGESGEAPDAGGGLQHDVG